MIETPVLLACYAHPDDESFGSGGTLAYYAQRDVHVALVCATRGEVGEISDPALATPETLAAVRENELRCACQAMGFDDLTFLDYRDSGMAGTPENDDPRAFVNVEAETVIARLVGLIRQRQPQVVMTFDPQGGYGHPDHLAIHRHTVAAFHAAGDANQYPEQGLPWQPSRLFYAVIPHSTFTEIRRQMAAQGLDTSRFDNIEDQAGFKIGWPDDRIDVVIDVNGTVEAKWTALHCHQTQFGTDSMFRQIPEADIKTLMSREHFVLAWPEVDWQGTDLFAGL